MTDTTRTLTVGVSLTVLDPAMTRFAAFAALVDAGDALPGEASAIPDLADALKVLCAPWRLIDGAEAVAVEVREEDGDHLVVATFAVEDAAMASLSASARLDAVGLEPCGLLPLDVMALLSARLAAPGAGCVEVQDGYADVDGGEPDFDVDVVLAAAAMLAPVEAPRLAA